MKEYQQRVIDEKNDLDNKIKRLTKFIFSDVFKEISIPEQRRLKRQRNIMEVYSAILSKRITWFKSRNNI